MVARSDTLMGTLTISEGYAEFVSGDVPERLPWTGASGRGERGRRFQPVLDVLVGRRGSDFVNRWIELKYGGSANPSTVYLNDGGWRGWRPILTRSNRKIAAELRALITTPHS